MIAFQFCDVVLVSFPFTGQSAVKQRPAVVVSSSQYQRFRPDLILMAVTSSRSRNSHFGDVAVTDWESAGLLRPSTIKPVFATVEQTLVRRRLGSLHADDSAALKRALAVVLG